MTRIFGASPARNASIGNIQKTVFGPWTCWINFRHGGAGRGIAREWLRVLHPPPATGPVGARRTKAIPAFRGRRRPARRAQAAAPFVKDALSLGQDHPSDKRSRLRNTFKPALFAKVYRRLRNRTRLRGGRSLASRYALAMYWCSARRSASIISMRYFTMSPMDTTPASRPLRNTGR